MYTFATILIVLLFFFLIKRFLFEQSYDLRPLAFLAMLVAASSLLSEIMLPHPFALLTYQPLSQEAFARSVLAQNILSLFILPAYLWHRRSLKPENIFFALLLVMATSAALQMLHLINLRIDYPFELEWMEGSMVDHVIQIKEGGSLYPVANESFIAWMYTPLYYRIVALFPYFEQSPFISARMVSYVATLMMALFVFTIVVRVSEDTWFALLMLLLTVAVNPYMGYWYDLARVDSVFVCFCLASLAILQRKSIDLPRMVVCGLMLALAVFAKQIAVIVVMVAVLLVLIRDGKKHALWLVVSGLLCGTLLTLYELWDSGLVFFDYICKIPMTFPTQKNYFTAFLKNDLLAMPFVAFLILYVLGIVLHVARTSWKQTFINPIILFSLAFIVMAAMMRSKPGGYINCRLPMIVGVLFGLSLFWAGEKSLGGGAKLFLVFVSALFLFKIYAPVEEKFSQLPSKDDLNASYEILEYLRNRPGRASVPCHSHLSYMAKKQRSFHCLAARDWNHYYPKSNVIMTAVRERRFDTLILNENMYGPLKMRHPLVKELYNCKRNPFDWGPRTLFPVTGHQTRPIYFCELKASPAVI
jgi:hypothetical protein